MTPEASSSPDYLEVKEGRGRLLEGGRGEAQCTYATGCHAPTVEDKDHGKLSVTTTYDLGQTLMAKVMYFE